MVGGVTHTNVRRWLPRVSRAQLLDWLGAPGLEPADGPLESVFEAMLAAACLGELHGSTRPEHEARRAALTVIGNRLPVAEVASLLCVKERTVFRLKRRAVDPRLVQAVRLQLDLRKSP